MSGLVASAIVLVSTCAVFLSVHVTSRTPSRVKLVLACLSLPGLAVGALIDLFRSRNFHGGGSDLPVYVGIPINWWLYYWLSTLVVRFRWWLKRP
jgi:hypothetical protein